MNFRVTTNGMFRSYRNNLNTNKYNLNKSMQSVQSGRYFNTYMEDPAAASRAFQLRRSKWRTEDQINNSNYIIGKFEVAFAALEPVVDSNGEGNDLSGIKASLEGLTDTAGTGRRVLGRNLQTVASSIAQLMNVKNGDEFVFAGADGLNVPFEWDPDAGVLRYNAYQVPKVDPDTGAPEIDDKTGKQKTVGADVNKMNYDEEQGKLYYQENPESGRIYFEDQTTYMDIGLGMKMDENGEIIPSSAYDASLSGLKFLNYGLDEDGDPKNLVVAMYQLGTIFARSTDTQFASLEDRRDAERLIAKVREAITYTSEQHLEISSRTIFLDENKNLLEQERDSINEEIVNTEDHDPAEAITDWLYAQYSYNAALRIGGGILSQSLLDYMS